MISYKRQLPFRYLRKTDASFPDLSQYLPKSQKTIWTSSIRLGLLDVFSSMSFAEDDFVLLPAISPQGLVLPLQKKKVRYHFYHMREGFEVDPGSIDSFLKTGRCRAVVFIHYFGKFNPQIYDVKRLCHDNNAYLFEDFVHGLFGRDDQNRPLGSIGDISFCSLPKFLPVPDGGVLFINNGRLQIKLHEKKGLTWCLSIFSATVSLLLNNVASKCKHRWQYNLINTWSKLHYAVYYKLLCSLRCNHAVSKITLNILRHIDFAQFIRERERAFNLINEKYNSYQETFMSPGYPIISPDAQQQRLAWKEKNVETLSYIKGWQYVPQSPEFEFERKLQLSHFLLPLNTEILPCL